MAFWLTIGAFIVAQNLQVALYGWAFNRVGEDNSTAARVLLTFREPVFLASLLLLSIATAACRLWLFPEAGVARTHVITSAAVVLSFGILSITFGEGQSLTRIVGATLCALGILLLSR